jgi:hypothetical protein
MGRTLGTPNNIFQEQEKKSDNDDLIKFLKKFRVLTRR